MATNPLDTITESTERSIANMDEYEDIPLIKPSEFVYIPEFGTSIPVRFLDASQVKMYDSEGNEVFCSCGKPAGSAIIGKNFSKAMCSECMYGE
jgi:hypothetical protein